MKNHSNYLKTLALIIAGIVHTGCESFTAANNTANNSTEETSMLSDGGAGFTAYTAFDTSIINAKSLNKDAAIYALSNELIIEQKGQKTSITTGHYTHLDAIEAGPLKWVISATDSTAQKIVFATVAGSQQQVITLLARPFGVNATCLTHSGEHTFAFVISEDGFIEQWFVADQGKFLTTPLLARSLPAPPDAEFCFTDSVNQRLFVNEESLGIWAYDTRLEADTARKLIAQVGKQHALAESAGNMLFTGGELKVIDSDAQQLVTLSEKNNQWQVTSRQSLAALDDAEQMQLIHTGNSRALVLRDETSRHWYGVPLRNIKLQQQAKTDDLAVVKAWRETDAVTHHGDAADDPAIWVNQANPEKSLILGTNKKAGLEVYDLKGKRLQNLAIGRLNNVDVRNHVTINGKPISLAVASHRDTNSLSVFEIDQASQKVTHLADLPTELQEIYGVCLYQPANDKLYAFANGKGGEFIQYQLNTTSKQLNATEVRRFQLESQPEGCVADDKTHVLFIGEEDVGVWAIDAAPEQPVKPVSVIKAGGILQADVEGLALYHAPQESLLVISSQGNDSYVVVSSSAPYEVKGVFRIGLNSNALIDGVSETDGLAVTSANLGGELSKGLLVVQDGRNRLPEEAQNFKLVPWAELPISTQKD